ncbi:MAG: DUF167 family protein [Pseudomonadales bacterium]|nr:DUF167 family protein [Pseudomonadales bacterium]MDP7146266.1 DUF167 family protein [Pseudomonadales bacterium]MDP7359072.1 DUF167 family protein [Pseudomonadales bacterium]HJN52133.1 DUF167 family protein [Pseudomonadales bacterium]
MADFYSWQGDDLHLRVRLQPKASQNRVVGVMGDAVKINVTAAPVDGKANACLGRYLAKQFHVPVSRVALVKGRNGRNKKLIITSPTVIPNWIGGK